MATLEEVYEELLASDDKKSAFTHALASTDAAEAFLAEHGCEATVDEFVAFLKDKASKATELSDEQLGDAAAGTTWWEQIIVSIGTLGLICMLD